MVRGLRWLPQLGWLGAGFGAAVLCAAMLCAAMLLVGACSFSRETVSDSTVPASTPATTISTTTTTTTTASTTSTTEDPAAAVVAAFAAYNRVVEEASNPFDPDYPGLDRYATGRVLERITEAFRELADQNAVTIGSYRYEVLEVDAVSAAGAELKICSLDEVETVAPTGEVLVPADDAAYVLMVEMTWSDLGWQVAGLSFESGEPVECVLSS